MIGFVDTAAGASGDMFLGALVDAGASVQEMTAAINALGTEQIRLEVTTTARHSIGATKVDVLAPASHAHRSWADIRSLLEDADLTDWVRRHAIDAFRRLAEAEAAVHRTTPERVHFHEVGGLDAIADVVGAMAGLDALGTPELAAGPVALGTGTVRGEHGAVPVPGPAVLALLRDAGAPVCGGPAPYEMCTPTGAAILAATVTHWNGLPPMTVATIGIGAGHREVEEVPNLLRIVIGESAALPAATTDTVFEANVDDLDPRLWPEVIDALLAAGASDAWLTPILMKKGRPAHTLHALAPAATSTAVRAAIFRTTSTIGLRSTAVTKVALDRESGTVDVGGSSVGVKVARHGGTIVNLSVEFDDVRRAAAQTGRSTKETLRWATAAAHARYGSPAASD